MKVQNRVGEQFGNYRLATLIGKGGYADVYLAENVNVNTLQYAIKILQGAGLQDYNQEEFLFEARTIASLQQLSSHIVQITDVGIQVDRQQGKERYIPYIVMEYAAGGTLRNRYHYGNSVPLERIVLYVNQVAEALQCAHERARPIIHRDIKPENMLLRSEDHVLLSDFGISISGRTGSQNITLPEEEVLGTAAYIAPERLSGNTRRASDQYSLGIVVYEWICGLRPFDGTNTEICKKQIRMPPPPLYPDFPHVTEDLWAVVARALAKNPEDRYPTVADFARALEATVTSATHNRRLVPRSMNNREPTLWQTNTLKLVPEPPPLPVPPTPPALSPELPLLPSLIPIAPAAPSQQSLPLVPPVVPSTQLAPVPLRVSSYQHHASTTVPFAQQNLYTAYTVEPEQARHPFGGVLDFFATSPAFFKDYRYTFFIYFGIFLNLLSSLTLSLLLHNIPVFLGGLLLPSLFFTLCVYFVEKTFALFFGLLVAGYWGGIGWVIGNYLATLLNLEAFLPSLFMASIFFILSMFLHIWYVLRKAL